MRRKLTCLALLTAAVAGTVLYTGRARATPSSGFTATTLAVGRFGEIDVFHRLKLEAPSGNSLPNREGRGHRKNVWQSAQRTRGDSDVYVQSNVWQPGGTSGWHTHPGHSLIIVTEGTVTTYEGDDPDCRPSVYTKGEGFVDEGGEHVHLIRNEGTVPASTIAVQTIPAGATRRIDAPDPGHCSF